MKIGLIDMVLRDTISTYVMMIVATRISIVRDTRHISSEDGNTAI